MGSWDAMAVNQRQTFTKGVLRINFHVFENATTKKKSDVEISYLS